MSAKARYFPGIDGLRAVAVLSVLLYHLHEGFLPGGYFGVDIFFVISGFVVTGSVAGARFDSLFQFQGHFYARRIVRIMPALVVCLVVTAIVGTLFIPSSWLSNMLAKTGLAAFFGGSNIVLALNNDEYFSPRAAFNPFVHTWSLGVEEQFYLLFPILIYFFHHERPSAKTTRAVAVISALSVISFALCGLMTWYRWEYAFYLIPARFWELGAGVVLYLSMNAWAPHISALSPQKYNLGFITGLLLVAVSFAIPATIFSPFPTALVPVAGTACLIAFIVAQPERALPAKFARPAPVFVGKISYSLYLWHWPTFVLFRWTVGLDQIQTCLAAVAIAVLLAIASYEIVEQPARKFQWQKRLSVAKFIPASLAVVLVITGATAAVFKYKSKLTLSVTGNTDVWYPLARKSVVSVKNCRIVRSDVVEGGVPLTVWKPTECQGALSAGIVYVVGDSHASAYTTMVRQFALDTGTTVKVYSHEGCAFIPLDRPIAEHDSDCRKSHQVIAQYLKDAIKPHDLVFLPSLRLPRFGNQWGDIDGESKASTPAAQNQAAVVAEAMQLLAPITQLGARVEFEAPKPIFRTPPFRCSDWFNRDNAVCAPGFNMSREDLEKLRTPILAAMTELTAKNSKISIWDPFPLLCPDQTCTSFRDGKPLFFDADHLSGFGNDLLYGNFSKNTLALMGSTQSANAEPSK